MIERDDMRPQSSSTQIHHLPLFVYMFLKNFPLLLCLNVDINVGEWHLLKSLFVLCFTMSYNTDIFQVPDPRNIQIQLTGFLQGKNARIFVGELWELLVSAQENIGGIPTAFLEKKKEEIRLRKVRKVQVSFQVKVSI